MLAGERPGRCSWRWRWGWPRSARPGRPATGSLGDGASRGDVRGRCGGEQLEARAIDGRLEIEPEPTPMHLDRRGNGVVAVPEVELPTLASWHEIHEGARKGLESRPQVVGHAVAESYSVLTRPPPPQRAPPTLVRDFLLARCLPSPKPSWLPEGPRNSPAPLRPATMAPARLMSEPRHRPARKQPRRRRDLGEVGRHLAVETLHARRAPPLDVGLRQPAKHFYF